MNSFIAADLMGCPTNKLSAERGGERERERERREEHANLVLSIVIILVGVWEPPFDGGRKVIFEQQAPVSSGKPDGSWI